MRYCDVDKGIDCAILLREFEEVGEMNKYFAIGCAWIAYGIAVASVALATHATASIAVTAIFGGLFVVVATVVLADSK